MTASTQLPDVNCPDTPLITQRTPLQLAHPASARLAQCQRIKL